MLRPLFKSHGGKRYLYDFIISHFPKDYIKLKYIEGCLGGGSVLLNKEPSVVEIGNDADPSIAGLYQELVVNDSNEFIKAVSKVRYSAKAFKWSKEASENSLGMDQSVAELCRRRMSRGGLREAFAWSERKRGGRPGDANAWATFKEQLPLIAARLKNVDIYCMPVADLIREFDASDVLWYVDPPYLPDTRSAKKAYAVEMTEEEHIELGKLLNKAKGKVVLSGYQSSLYAKLYKDWNMSCKSMKNHAGQGKMKQNRIEVLWCNY